MRSASMVMKVFSRPWLVELDQREISLARCCYLIVNGSHQSREEHELLIHGDDLEWGHMKEKASEFTTSVGTVVATLKRVHTVAIGVIAHESPWISTNYSSWHCFASNVGQRELIHIIHQVWHVQKCFVWQADFLVVTEY
jgi:hypothetical protein